jgi:hypothetical protein
MANQTAVRMLAAPAIAAHRLRGGSLDHALRTVTMKAVNAVAKMIWSSYGNEGSLVTLTSIRSPISHTAVMANATTRLRRISVKLSGSA